MRLARLEFDLRSKLLSVSRWRFKLVNKRLRFVEVERCLFEPKTVTFLKSETDNRKHFISHEETEIENRSVEKYSPAENFNDYARTRFRRR